MNHRAVIDSPMIVRRSNGVGLSVSTPVPSLLCQVDASKHYGLQGSGRTPRNQPLRPEFQPRGLNSPLRGVFGLLTGDTDRPDHPIPTRSRSNAAAKRSPSPRTLFDYFSVVMGFGYTFHCRR